jgi:phosphatidate cytidylyltransferase
MRRRRDVEYIASPGRQDDLAMTRGGDLAPRLVTLLVLVPALIGVIFADPTMWGVVAAAAVAGTLALDEFVRMLLGLERGAQLALRLIVAGFGAALIAAPALVVGLGLDRTVPVQPLLLSGATIGIGGLVLLQHEARSEAPRRFAVALAGLVYIPLLLSVLPRIKAERADHGAAWLLLVIAIPFVADGAAYIAGRLLGRHKLYPSVSPGKTWEGAAGGLAGSVGAVLAIRAIALPQLALGHALAAALIASVAGQAGDLFESALKRAAGVKDSGRLLPGHGGMLDRIDALLFAAPVAYYYLSLVAGAATSG